MRRTPGASASRLCGRVCAVPLIAGMLLATPGLAVAQPGSPDSLGALVAAVANVNQKLQDLGAAIQAKQESVNKAIVDVQTARDNAAAAQRELDASATASQGCEHRDRGRAASLRHVRRRNVCQRSVEFLPDRVRSQRHPQHRRHRSDAGGQHAAGHHRSAARPHRAGEQGVGRAAGQAERRPGGHRRGSQPADRGVGADRGPADVQRPAGRTGPVDGRTRRRAGQARRGRNWSAPAAGDSPACRSARRGVDAPQRPAANWDRAPAAQATPAAGNWDTALGIPPCPRFPAHSSAATRSRSSTRSSGYVATSAQVTQQTGSQLPAEARPDADPDRLHQRRDSPRLRQAGHRVRDQARPWRSGACRTRGAAATPQERARASIPVRAQSVSTAPA